jgi:uncharacterized protein YuzE
MKYFKDEDILHVMLMEGHESNSVEISPNITAELNESGEVIGIEIIKASAFIRDFVLDSVQAKLLHLTSRQAATQSA